MKIQTQERSRSTLPSLQQNLGSRGIEDLNQGHIVGRARSDSSPLCLVSSLPLPSELH